MSYSSWEFIKSAPCNIFKCSLLEGVFPACWKLAILSPILKSEKDALLPSLYRPIALLTCVSKVFERLVHKQLVCFCFKNGLLPAEQFGFPERKTTEWQLLSVLQDWHSTLDRKSCVHTVLMLPKLLTSLTIRSNSTGWLALQWLALPWYG